jgi:hypothetical protein
MAKKKFDIKNYMEVKDRIVEFFVEHPEGSIKTNMELLEGKMVVFKATAYRNPEEAEKDVGTTGWAYELEGEGHVNETSFLENCECCPLTVPALTRTGWKYYHQLQVGEDLLTYSVKRGQLEWQPLQRKAVFQNQSVVRIGHTRFSAVCTPNHKWVVNGELTEWRNANRVSGKILLAATYNQTLRQDRVQDAARLGWLFGDAVISSVGGGLPSRAAVHQSKEEYFEELDTLFGDSTLKAEAGERHWDNGHTSATMVARYWAVAAEETRRIMGVFGVSRDADLIPAVLSMNHHELEAFLSSMLKSDGSKGRYAKTKLARVEAVQLAMFLTGHATGRIEERKPNYMTTKPCYTVPLHKKGYKWLSDFTEETLPPQDVWCPTTDNGTWVGLFDGRPAITGNTSSVGRALANMGYGVDANRPSRTEMLKVERMQAEQENRLAYIEGELDYLGEEEGEIEGEKVVLQKYIQQHWEEIEKRPRLAKAVETALLNGSNDSE